jgi:hypothetical protein
MSTRKPEPKLRTTVVPFKKADPTKHFKQTETTLERPVSPIETFSL